MDFDWLSLETLESLAQQYGYIVVFLGILLESLGLPLPGESIVLVGGFLAGEGELSYRWVLVSAIAGAMIGGSCGYWIGVYGGWPLLLKAGQLFQLEEEKLVEMKVNFANNAGRAVFLGRFVALLRIFASPLAGIAEMPFGPFLIYNCAGAVAWGTVMISLAYFAGEFIPLTQLVGSVAQVSLVLLVGLALWFGRAPLLRQVKGQFVKQAGEPKSP